MMTTPSGCLCFSIAARFGFGGGLANESITPLVLGAVTS
jgi:hypothetical protein